MDDDDQVEPRKTYPLSPAKMSKTPSWAMVGFLLGAAFVWNFKRDGEKNVVTAPSPSARMDWPKVVVVSSSPLTTIEAVFADWGQHAVWENGVTELALWRSETKSFSEFYEVRKVGDVPYFRSIPKLTRLVINHGVPLPNSPLQFTETEEQYREWLEHGRFERKTEATVQPSLFGPALIPPNETMPRIPAPTRVTPLRTPPPTPTTPPLTLRPDAYPVEIALPPKN